jgi:flagellar FliL protein
MAKDAKPAEDSGGTPAPKKSKKLLIIIIAVVVLVLGIGGAAAFLLMGKNADHGDEEEAATEKSKPASKKKKGEKEAPPAYVALEAFTVNLIPEAGDQFLQLIISVEVPDVKYADELKVYMPKLRNNIMLLLSDKKASQLITKEGKELLAAELRDQMNVVLDPTSKGKKAEGPIREVLFTSFIIQ